MGKYAKEQHDEEMLQRQVKKVETVDLLKNSELTKG
jgi:hypothetical protein